MPPRLRVGVIFGGQSGEHEVSLASALAAFNRLQSALGLTPGRPVEFSGAEAVAFAARLAAWDGDVRGTAHRAFLIARVSTR